MDDRAAKIEALIAAGATAGERAAARFALGRIQSSEADRVAELERAVGFGWRPPHVESSPAEHAALMGRLDSEAAMGGGYE